MTARALNLGGYSYFDATFPFINLLRSADSRWSLAEYPSAPYTTVDGWLAGIPNGAATQSKIIYFGTGLSGNPYAYIRTGTYKIRWSGNATVGVQSSTGLTTPAANNSGTYTFTVNQNSPDSIIILITNISGSAVNWNAGPGPDGLPAIYHTDDEADYNAGKIFQSDFVDSLDGATVLRQMDWAQINNIAFAVFNYSDLHLEGDCTWTDITSSGRRGCPATVIGKLGTLLAVDLWINTPWNATDAYLTAYYTALFGTYPSGNVYVEAGNEGWNNSVGANQWLSGIKAPTLPSYPTCIKDFNGNTSSAAQDKTACAAADCAAAAWTAAEGVFPTARIRRVMGAWSALANYYSGFYEYTDPRSSTKIKTMLNSSRGRVAIAPYLDLIATPALPDVSKKGMAESKAYLQPDSDYVDSLSHACTDYLAAQIIAHQNNINAKCPSCLLTTYECGQSCLEAAYEPASVYTVTVNSGTNLLINGSSWAAGWTNGEQAYLDYYLTLAPQNLSSRTPYIKLNGTTGLELYTDAGLTNRIILVADGGTYFINNYTRSVLLDTKFKNIFDGTSGRDAYVTYYADIFVGQLELFNHFVSTGTYLQNYGEQYGLKRSQFLPDTPRGSWFEGTPAIAEIVSTSDQVGGSILFARRISEKTDVILYQGQLYPDDVMLRDTNLIVGAPPTDMSEIVTAFDTSNSSTVNLLDQTEAGIAADAPDSSFSVISTIAETDPVFDATSGGLVSSISEAGTAVDAISLSLAVKGDQVESGAGADIVSSVLLATAAMVEIGTASDIVNTILIAKDDITEIGVLADLDGTILFATASATEIGVASDVLVALLLAKSDITESRSALDIISAAGPLAGSQLETGAVADVAVASLTDKATIAEASSAAEFLSGMALKRATLADFEFASDLVGAGVILNNLIHEAGSVIELTSVSLVYNILETGALLDVTSGIILGSIPSKVVLSDKSLFNVTVSSVQA